MGRVRSMGCRFVMSDSSDLGVETDQRYIDPLGERGNRTGKGAWRDLYLLSLADDLVLFNFEFWGSTLGLLMSDLVRSRRPEAKILACEWGRCSWVPQDWTEA